MNHLQYFFKSSENQDISAHIWEPENEIKAVMIICHGMAEHIKRYERFAEFMTKNHILICGIDLPGHGDSSADILGFFSYKNGGEYVTQCILDFKKDIAKKYPCLPMIVFGHSMGSFFVRNIAANHSEGIDCFIFSGTAGPNKQLILGKTLAQLEFKFRGHKHVSSLLNDLSFKPYNKAFKPNRTEFDWLSRDNAEVDKYVADVKCGFIFTSSAFYDFFKILQFVNSQPWVGMLIKEKSYLLVSGQCDPVGQFGKGVIAVYRNMLNAGIDNVEYKLYKGGRHEMINEINYKEVYEDVLSFINRRLNLGE